MAKYGSRQITTDISCMWTNSELVQWYHEDHFDGTAMHHENMGKTKREQHASSLYFQSLFRGPLTTTLQQAVQQLNNATVSSLCNKVSNFFKQGLSGAFVDWVWCICVVRNKY